MKNVRPRHVVIMMFSFLTCAAFLTGVTVHAQRAPAIAAIDDSNRVTLPRTTHPLARPGFEIGSAEPNLRMERMLLVLGPSDEVQPQLRALIDGQHDKKSPNYHKWITPEQFGERFGPSQQDLVQVTSWLQQKGFDNVKLARGRTSIEFSGSAQLVQQAFATQMHYYQQNGEKHLANATDISIPRAMSGIVRGVRLENFSFSKPTLSGAAPVARGAGGKFASIDPQAKFGGINVLAPGDYAKIYDLGSLYNSGNNGAGVTIAVVARSNIELSDVETFRQAFGLPLNDPNIIVNGQDPGPSFSLDLVEASLDTEWTGAIAPNATVDVVVSQSTLTTDGVVLSSTYIVDNNLADIMSMSFTSCEPNLGSFNAFFNALFQQAAAQGISVFVSTGDSGAAACDANSNGPAQGGLAVNGLASTPFNTAVGGTQFEERGNPATYWGINGPNDVSVLGYIPEKVWNESCDPTKTTCPFGPSLAGTGGGVSTVYSKPSWQSTGVTGVPNDNQRDLPDVSLTGAVHDDYIFCTVLFAPCSLDTSGTQPQLLTAGSIGGTSASVQAFAGIMALVDQRQGGRQGLANYVLYKLAASETFANCDSSSRIDPTQPAPAGCVFNDITVKSNGVPGNDTLSGTVPPGDKVGQLGYNALPGFDSATGLGSVDAANLVNSWNSVTFRGSTTTLAASGITSVPHGQAVSFNIGVSALAGTGTPSGPVVLIAQNAPAPFNNTPVGSGTLADGVFSSSVNSLPGGQYNVVAHYGGDGVFGGSESNAVAVNVAQESSSVTLTGHDQDGNPFAAPAAINLGFGLGQPIEIDVTSTSGNGVPTGTVSLLDAGIQIAQLPLNNEGHARFVNCDPLSATFCLAMGPHNLTAVYSGDSGLTPSSSPALTISVVKGPVAFVALFACCFTNQAIEVEADLDTGAALLGFPPTGTVSFADTMNGTTTSLGPPVPLPQIPIIIRFFDLVPGTHTITAQYSGDSNYLPGSGVSAPFVIPGTTLLPTQTTLQLLTNPIAEGQTATFQVTVTSSQSSATPTGNVLVLAGASTVDPQANLTLVNGSVKFKAMMPNASTSIQAFYFGDSTFDSSSSPPLLVSVDKLTVPLVISSNVQTTQAGTQVSLTGAITPPVGLDQPAGTVQFFDSFNGGQAVPLGQTQVVLPGSGTVASVGIVSIPAFLPAGVNVITAAYSGDLNYNPVPQSNSVTITVSGTPPLFGFTTAKGGDAVTISTGQTAQFNVSLNGNGFVGMISLSCSGAPAGTTCTANPAPAELTETVTSVGLVVTVAPGPSRAANSRRSPFLLALALGFAPLGLLCSKRQARKALLVLGALCLIVGMGACGGGSSNSTPPPPPPPQPKTYTLTLNGTDGTASSSIPLTLTVKP